MFSRIDYDLLAVAFVAVSLFGLIVWRAVRHHGSWVFRTLSRLAASFLWLAAVGFIALYVAANSQGVPLDWSQKWQVTAYFILPALGAATVLFFAAPFAQKRFDRQRRERREQNFTDGVAVPIRLHQPRESFPVSPPPPSHRP